MNYYNKIMGFISSHKTLSKALLLIVLVTCLWTLYGPKKFEYLCPVQEIQSCTIYEYTGGRELREIILTKEQENELIELLTQQYFRCVVFQNAATPSGPNRHSLLISFWRGEGEDGELRICSLGIDSCGYIHGHGKKYESVFLPWNKKDLYNDIIRIIGNESLYWRMFQ